MNSEQYNSIMVKQYHDACNDLAKAINGQLFDGEREWYWVGSGTDSIGGLCDFDDADVLSPEDMARILAHGMTYDQYAEWRDANIEHDKQINLKSWLMGARFDDLPKEQKPQEQKHDNVNHPSHYAWLIDLCGVEPIDICREFNFNVGNALKYLMRKGKKDGNMTDKEKRKEDLRKAIFYLNDELTRIDNEQSDDTTSGTGCEDCRNDA